MKKDFSPKMKVELNGEHGIVLDEYREWDGIYFVEGKVHKGTPMKNYGIIRWDTNKTNDSEDWIGLFGSFAEAGGKEITQNHKFKFINDEGALLN